MILFFDRMRDVQNSQCRVALWRQAATKSRGVKQTNTVPSFHTPYVIYNLKICMSQLTQFWFMSSFFNAHLNSACEGVSAEGGGRQEEDVESKHWEPWRGQGDGSGRLWSLLLAWSIAQRGVAAGDAHWVELAGAELLVARRSDETSSWWGAGLAVVYPWSGTETEALGS